VGLESLDCCVRGGGEAAFHSPFSRLVDMTVYFTENTLCRQKAEFIVILNTPAHVSNIMLEMVNYGCNLVI